MSDLPQGWEEATIADVTTAFVSIDPTKLPNQTFRYVDIGSIDNRSHTIADSKAFIGRDAPSRARRVIQADDTLFSTVRTYLKNIALVPAELSGELTSTGIAVLRPSCAVDANYLFRWVSSDPFVNELSAAQDGTMYPAVSDKDVASATILVPPLAEQRRIVAKIDSLTGKSRRARNHLDHIPRLVEKYKQAILAAAFRGDLTREWRGLASKYDIEWETHELGDIADIGTGATPKRGRTDYYEGGTIAWVTSGTVNEGIITHADEYITPAALNETNCKTYPAGTLLMAMYGEGKTRGKVAILGIEAATNQALAAIQVRHRGPASPSFVLWYLRSQYLSLRDQAAGGVQPNLNLGIIKRTSIDLPSSSEQDEIVRRIEAAFAWVNRLTADAASARKLVNNLDQAVLAKAFRGELVPQDPADEPASALLERIRAERAAAPKAKRGRRKAV